MTTLTPNYSKLSVIKSPTNKDPNPESGDSFVVWIDCNQHIGSNSTQGSKIILTLSYIDGYTSGNPILKKGSSKRWFVWYKFTTNIYWNGGMITSYGINIWDNHGQRYDHQYVESTDPSYYKKIIIQEDDKKFPEPLPDIMIDYIKGAPIPFHTITGSRVERSIFDFQTKLNHLYIPRTTVSKDMAELETLRKEVAELRGLSSTRLTEIQRLREGMEVLEKTHDETIQELKEQKSLTKVLHGSLDKLLSYNDKNTPLAQVPESTTCEYPVVIHDQRVPLAIVEQPANPFDTL